MSQDAQEIVVRLRELRGMLLQDAADLIERQAKRIAELEAEVERLLGECRSLLDQCASIALGALGTVESPERSGDRDVESVSDAGRLNQIKNSEPDKG